jgi:hypothetical protein
MKSEIGRRPLQEEGRKEDQTERNVIFQTLGSRSTSSAALRTDLEGAAEALRNGFEEYLRDHAVAGQAVNRKKDRY